MAALRSNPTWLGAASTATRTKAPTSRAGSPKRMRSFGCIIRAKIRGPITSSGGRHANWTQRNRYCNDQRVAYQSSGCTRRSANAAEPLAAHFSRCSPCLAQCGTADRSLDVIGAADVFRAEVQMPPSEFLQQVAIERASSPGLYARQKNTVPLAGGAVVSPVRPTGFEPVTLGSEDRCAIQLRHGAQNVRADIYSACPQNTTIRASSQPRRSAQHRFP